MTTKSAADFEWCVKLMKTVKFNVGIASEHKQGDLNIVEYDKNAVFFTSYNGPPAIKIGSETIHSNFAMERSEHVIRFRFRPEQKKLVIDLVRVEKSIIRPEGLKLNSAGTL